MKAVNILFVLLLLICGCSRGEYNQFEQTVSRLKPGMKRGEVKQVFASFNLIDETNVVYTLDSETKWYATNLKQCIPQAAASKRGFVGRDWSGGLRDTLPLN